MNRPMHDSTPHDGLHVVLGAGAIGLAVGAELVRRGRRVRIASSSGSVHGLNGVEVFTGDLSDQETANRATAGADVVYHTVAPSYPRWAELFPRLHGSIIEAAARAGAVVVMADNLYMYGNPGVPMTEDTEVAPITTKGRLRAQMADALLEAHREGRIRAVIGRASDYFGPRGRQSHMGDRVFAPLLAGKKAQVMGNPDTRHTYTYLPDIGRALPTLGTSPEASGEVWHIPSPPAVTTRQFVQKVAEQLDVSPELSVMPPLMLRILAWFSPMLRAVRAELHQVESDWVMDDAKYRNTFGQSETPLDDAIAETIDWYRRHAE